MYTQVGKLNLESFAIIESQDEEVISEPDLPTWDDNQPPQYRKSSKLPHQILRIPETSPVPRELQIGRGLPQIIIDPSDPVPFIVLPKNSTSPIRSATWRLHWPVTSRGTCACVGIAAHPNTPDSPIDILLYWNLASGYPNRSSTAKSSYSSPSVDFTMTLSLQWKSRALLEASLSFDFIDLPPTASRTIQRELPLGQFNSPSTTLTPFISTAWGRAEVTMEFVGFLKHGTTRSYALLDFVIMDSQTKLKSCRL